MKRPRWIQRLRALLGGYFWLPCPTCGRMFGGHETSAASIPTGAGSGRCICPACAVAGVGERAWRAYWGAGGDR